MDLGGFFGIEMYRKRCVISASLGAGFGYAAAWVLMAFSSIAISLCARHKS